MSRWSAPIQLDSYIGLWYKFKQDRNGNWHILCSGDRQSLEKDSVVYHDHYWQSNNKWYFQGKKNHNHIIGRDELIQGIQKQNERGSLKLSDSEKQEININSEQKLTQNQIKNLANYRANQAYGNAGYEGNIHGIEMPPYAAQSCNRLVQQYQSSTNYLNWRDLTNDTDAVSKNKDLKWKNTTQYKKTKTRKNNRKNTR